MDVPYRPRQEWLFEAASVREAINLLAEAGVEERGAVFTRREVVEFILDLMGYVPEVPLNEKRLLEPSFGGGDFLLVAVERLLAAYRSRRATDRNPAVELRDAVRAVELHRASFNRTRAALAALLRQNGLTPEDTKALLKAWLIQGDFLLEEIPFQFSYVVGNPPYVRQELIADVLITEYRRRFRTIYDRADLYIPFIEKSLLLLEPSGHLGFICSDRWMKNRYGGPLRQLVAEHFYLKHYVDMVDTPAFHSEVIAYPAITVIARETAGATRLARRPPIEAAPLKALAQGMRGPGAALPSGVKEVSGIANGAEPWILESFDQLDVVRRLEAQFSTLEDAGCKVGIGVATGADRAFIAPFGELDVESDRKLPLVMTTDIESGTVEWRGRGIINPFADDGGLIELRRYPRLAAYLRGHEATIRKRHIAQKNPQAWYRTIDRIYPALTHKPKLLIPDIKGEAHIVYEDGRFYPHHNLYYVLSEEWDLSALRAVLLSGIARLFVSIYSTKMRGGFLRFQAQYLRRIRIPRWHDVPGEVRTELIAAGERDDIAACNEAVCELYGLTKAERAAVGGNGTQAV